MYDPHVLKLLEICTKRKVQIVQNQWIDEDIWGGEICRYCRVNGIHYQTYWTLTGLPNTVADTSIEAITQAKGYTPAQVLFKLAQLHDITPLSAAITVREIERAVKAENINVDIADEDGARANAALNGVER